MRPSWQEGKALKALGTNARREMEEFLGRPVFLEVSTPGPSPYEDLYASDPRSCFPFLQSGMELAAVSIENELRIAFVITRTLLQSLLSLHTQ